MNKEKLKDLIKLMEDAVKKHGKFQIKMQESGIIFSDERRPFCCHGGFLGTSLGLYGNLWYEGANEGAKFLGFADRLDLMRWAWKNPEIWGNDRGSKMFMDASSFGFAYFDYFSSDLLIRHWEGVLERLEAGR